MRVKPGSDAVRTAFSLIEISNSYNVVTAQRSPSLRAKAASTLRPIHVIASAAKQSTLTFFAAPWIASLRSQ
jgi:hypothetical protein